MSLFTWSSHVGILVTDHMSGSFKLDIKWPGIIVVNFIADCPQKNYQFLELVILFVGDSMSFYFKM